MTELGVPASVVMKLLYIREQLDPQFLLTEQ